MMVLVLQADLPYFSIRLSERSPLAFASFFVIEDCFRLPGQIRLRPDKNR